MRLLLVEDDRHILEFVKRALSEAGYQVDAAANAKAGEAMAVENPHDALVIDLGLPDLDGLELIARCRAQGVSAPVLILSARRSVDEEYGDWSRGRRLSYEAIRHRRAAGKAQKSSAPIFCSAQ